MVTYEMMALTALESSWFRLLIVGKLGQRPKWNNVFKEKPWEVLMMYPRNGVPMGVPLTIPKTLGRDKLPEQIMRLNPKIDRKMLFRLHICPQSKEVQQAITAAEALRAQTKIKLEECCWGERATPLLRQYSEVLDSISLLKGHDRPSHDIVLVAGTDLEKADAAREICELLQRSAEICRKMSSKEQSNDFATELMEREFAKHVQAVADQWQAACAEKMQYVCRIPPKLQSETLEIMKWVTSSLEKGQPHKYPADFTNQVEERLKSFVELLQRRA